MVENKENAPPMLPFDIEYTKLVDLENVGI